SSTRIPQTARWPKVVTHDRDKTGFTQTAPTHSPDTINDHPLSLRECLVRPCNAGGVQSFTTSSVNPQMLSWL
ncbi:MAG: hypothetical protein AAFO75_13860, partial [Pseudomonadota bacterium]